MTRDDAEQALDDLVGGFYDFVRIVHAGPTPIRAYSGPISAALDACGVPATNPANPTDDDMVRLPNASWQKFLDIAEYKALDKGSGRLGSMESMLKNEDMEVDFNNVQMYKDVLKSKLEFVMNVYGYGAATLQPGGIRLGFRRSRPEF